LHIGIDWIVLNFSVNNEIINKIRISKFIKNGQKEIEAEGYKKGGGYDKNTIT